jgi:hypothetical protein
LKPIKKRTIKITVFPVLMFKILDKKQEDEELVSGFREAQQFFTLRILISPSKIPKHIPRVLFLTSITFSLVPF